MSKSYVGLDMSMSATGFCRIEGAEVFVDTIKTEKKKFNVIFDRLEHIVKETMKGIPDDVSLVCIEDYFIPRNVSQIKAAINLGALGTMIRGEMYKKGIPFIVVSPQQLKKFVLSKGNMSKSLIIKEVYKKWAVDAKDDNQADACVLAKTAMAIDKYVNDKTKPEYKYQWEVVKKVTESRPRYNYEIDLNSKGK